MNVRSIVAATLAGAILVALGGCGQSDGEGRKYRIAVIPKGTSHQFWASVHAGAEKAAKELGNVDILWDGPVEESDTNGQVKVMQNVITKRVDGICLAPNHSQSLVKYVREANDEEIPVVIFDSGLGEGAEIVSYVATNNYNGGRLAARCLAKAMGNKGNVILLRYRAGSESTEQREEGFKETIESEFPDIKFISSQEYGEGTVNSSRKVMSQLLNDHEDRVNGVFAVCEPNGLGVLRALEDATLTGKVKFVAFDPHANLIAGLKDDKVHGIVLQDPVMMGYEAVMTMVQHLEGKKPKARVETGEHVAEPGNMDEPEMQLLLDPARLD